MRWDYRYSVLLILVIAYLLCYMDRMVMASAIPFIAQDFHLSPLSMGAVLSAFFAGYTVMQIPGGLLADRFGPRAVLTISIAWWSVLTALTGMASGLTTLLTLRVLFGVGEGPFPSAAAKTLSIWFPQRELGQANGLLIASTLIGATVAPLFTAALIASWGWRSVFFALFTPGLVLAVVVWRFVQNSPPDRKQLTPRRVTEYRDTRQKKLFAKTNLGEILRTPTVLWCAACAFLSNMLAWGLLNWLPTYLLQARGFGIAKMGMFVALTNLAGVLGYPLGGYICDKYFASRLNVPILIGLIVGGVLTYLAATAPTGEWAVAYLVLAGLLGAIGGTALYTLPLTVVPKYAVGGAFGIVNTAGQLAGVFSPLLVGYILKVTDGNFQIVLYWLVGISILAVYPAARLRQSNVSGVQPAV